MKKKYFLLLILCVTGKFCFSQIYGVGNGDGFSYDCYTQADNPFTFIYKTGNGGDKMMDCIIWGQPVTLPNHLLTFDVVCINNKPTMLWSVAVTVPGITCIIERSTDKIHFLPIGSLREKENNNQAQHYNFVDDNDMPGIAYYRLKRTGANGQYEYSKLSAANCKENNTGTMKVYPNPTAGLLNIVTGGTYGSLIVKNMLGQPVYNGKVSAAVTTINIGHLPMGIYYAEVRSGKNIYYQVIVVTKK